jgi:DNA-binding PadR family transcriptional regulator
MGIVVKLLDCCTVARSFLSMADASRTLSQPAVRILLALTAGERHGYAVLQELRADGLGKALGPGSLYRTIQSLVTDGLITESSGAQSDSTDERRRYFRLTAAGRRTLVAETQRLSEIVKRASAKGVLVAGRR